MHVEGSATMQNLSATPGEVAARLWELLRADGILPHNGAVGDIRMRFGEWYLLEDENGSIAIDRAVLAEFDRLKQGGAEWDGDARTWILTEDAQQL